MGMQALMNILCTNLNNNMCDWFARLYDPDTREFVIPGRGRIPLDEDSVFNTLGVPNAGMDVPYKVDKEVQARIFPEMFPGMNSLPLNSAFATMLGAMETSGEDFKRKLLMYLISNVFAPTTSLRPSSRCFPILDQIDNVANMNWCKFIAGFLHTSLSNKMYNKGCRLHLMLMYVDKLDISSVNLTCAGGLPPPHKFAASAWSDAAIKAVLAADRKRDGTYGKLQLMGAHNVDYSLFGGPNNFTKWMDVHTNASCSTGARSNIENLVGQFASGMTNLLGNLVQGWTAMSGGDGEEVANQFRSFVRGGTSRPTGSRARYDYNTSQELPHSEDDLSSDGSDYNEDDDKDDSRNEDDIGMDDIEHGRTNEQPHEVVDGATTKEGLAGPSVTSSSGVQASKRARDVPDAHPESAAKKTKTDPVAARRSEATAGGRVSNQRARPASRSSARLSKVSRTTAAHGHGVAHTAIRSSPRFASSNTGDPVVLEDLRGAGKRVRNKTSNADPVHKTKKKDPLERMHTKLSSSNNVDRAKAAAATNSDAPAKVLSSVAAVLTSDGGVGAGGSDELISPRSAEIAPALISMRHGPEGGPIFTRTGAGHDTQQLEGHLSRVQADTQPNPAPIDTSGKTTEQHHPSHEDCQTESDATAVQNKGPDVTHPKERPAPQARTATALPEQKTDRHDAPQKMAKAQAPTRRSPRKSAAQAGNVHAQHAQDAVPKFVSASTLFPPIPEGKTADHAHKKAAGVAKVQKPTVLREENSDVNPRLKHTRVPLEMGVPYAPRVEHPAKGTSKKVVINIPDTTPRPTMKPKDSGSADSEMFIDLSPLAAAIGVIEKQKESKVRDEMEFTPPSCSLGLDLSQPIEPVDAIPVSYALPSAPAPMMAQPIVDGRKAVKFAEPIVQDEVSPVEVTASMDEAFCKMEEDALMRKKLQTKGSSSSAVTDTILTDDVHNSVTPGSVRQARVVQPPTDIDSEPSTKSTKQQQAFYDIIRRFGNSRNNSIHMNAIRETKVIQCFATYVDLGDLAESLMPNEKLPRNVVSAGIDYINSQVDIHCDKIIMSPTITRRIWEGDFSHAQICKVFAQHGDYKLTLKKFVMFTMFQELAPDDPHDKAGHYYTICINLAKQRFDVLDSLCTGDDESLCSHAEFFIKNLKETWLRHYSGSKVQIEYVKSVKQGNTHDCGIYLLEYLAKWEGRKVPILNKAIVAELRKIYLWNWVTNADFNKREGAKSCIENEVKAAIKRYR